MDRAPTGDKSLRFLSALIGGGQDRSIRQVAEQMDVPLSTAHRMAATFVRAGFLAHTGKGTYGAGLELMNLAAKGDRVKVLKYIVRPHLQKLALKVGYVAHLGILENDMVTYVLKIQGGRSKVFTKTGMQLEAYCSAIGKMLLASAPKEELERYLADEPFVPLTKNTISNPGELRRALDDIREVGFAFDGEEVAEGLVCIAVPLRNRRGEVQAAISLAARSTREETFLKDQLLTAIKECAEAISLKL
jgi:DNA-binding IclR family transcriptional regulator